EKFAVDRRKRSRCFLQGGDRGQDRRVHAGEWRLPAESRFRKTYIDLGGAGFDDVSWLPGFRASTKRSGHSGFANIKHPGRVRSACDGTRFARNIARHGRSEENRLGRSGEVLCRSRVCQDSAGRSSFEKLRGAASQANRSQSRGEKSRGWQSRSESG